MVIKSVRYIVYRIVGIADYIKFVYIIGYVILIIK